MNAPFDEAVAYLYSFVNFEHYQPEQFAPEYFPLERPAKFLEELGNPHYTFPSIHIAGTKGKGSVAAMCASCLAQAGLRVGLYTSPHLGSFRERIRILEMADRDGQIAPEEVVELIDLMKLVIDRTAGLTWYEIMTAMAFVHFKRRQVDIAVVEVGLGGRLDATNVLKPMVSVITALSLDHTKILGDTLESIANEKGGIIKPGIGVVSAAQEPSAEFVLTDIAGKQGSPISMIGRDWQGEAIDDNGDATLSGTNQTFVVTKTPPLSFITAGTRFKLALYGSYQRENALLALAALDAVHKHFPTLNLEAVRAGLRTVEWPGRLQMILSDQDYPRILLDCAHNVDSAGKLAFALTNEYEFRRLILVIGLSQDKDVPGVLGRLLPLGQHVILTASDHPRAATPEALQRLVKDLGYDSECYANVRESLIRAWQLSENEDLICVTGSVFIVGNLLNGWESLKSELIQYYPRR